MKLCEPADCCVWYLHSKRDVNARRPCAFPRISRTMTAASCAVHRAPPRCTESSFISWWLVGILLGALGFLLPTFSGRGLEQRCTPGHRGTGLGSRQAARLEGREGTLVVGQVGARGRVDPAVARGVGVKACRRSRAVCAVRGSGAVATLWLVPTVKVAGWWAPSPAGRGARLVFACPGPECVPRKSVMVFGHRIRLGNSHPMPKVRARC